VRYYRLDPDAAEVLVVVRLDHVELGADVWSVPASSGATATSTSSPSAPDDGLG
jgi:hypothetical protein